MDFSELNAEYIVFLAIGSPKQEWIAEIIYQKVGAKCICVGGAVNMLEGREKIVPLFIKNVALNGYIGFYRTQKGGSVGYCLHFRRASEI